MHDHDLPDDLAGLAGLAGVQTSYWDTRGDLHHAAPDALVAVLRARGVELDGPDDLGSLRRHLRSELLQVVPLVVVAWSGVDPASTHPFRSTSLRFPLALSATTDRGPVRVSVADHEGSELSKCELDIDTLIEIDRHDLDGAVVVRQVDLALDAELPFGYYRLTVARGDDCHRSHLLVAPSRVVQPPPDERGWGLFAPLYSLRAELGIGPHVGDLQALGEWLHPIGGRVVATLPLLASYLDQPFDPSPYAPVSRQFWNELYLDIERVPELARSPKARSVLDSPETQREIAELRALGHFDYRRQAHLTGTVLGELAATFFADPGAEAVAYHRFLTERPDVVDYARFRGAVAHYGTGWHSWPEPARAGELSDDDVRPDAVERHLYAQFAMHRQMGELATRLREREQRLYLDLPVGAHGDGYDTWSERDLFAWGMGTGAPPDDFFTEGQNWGFPPVNPDASRRSGHRHFAECLRHHMGAAGMLRLDHVMQLHRLYWVPDGMTAREGVYVSYPREELFAVLAVESARSGCVVVGEDLGTVPDEIRQAMDRHGLAGMYVAQFEMPSWPGADLGTPSPGSLAALNTHDTPTFTGYLHGLDITFRHDLGLLDDGQAAVERADREQAVANLVRFLAERSLLDEPGDEHEILRGVLRHLAVSEASTMLLALDDLWGETEPHNVPGTVTERPNWALRMRDSLAALAVDDVVRNDLELLQQLRLAAHGRAQGMS
jgi:4-alpha-glucanotransferase